MRHLEIRERPESLTPSPSAPKPQGFLRGLFDDLSIAQVIAGALAAATVFSSRLLLALRDHSLVLLLAR